MAPKPATLRAKLLSWYERSHRDLPWRRTRDAYRVWVSEIMLQQTRVETVIPYYERFLARFPDVGALAEAPLDDVLAAWSGLGYYRRARFLHRAAASIVREHDGGFPRSLETACELPGIGRSTAGAIVSIAYGERTPVLDGNVRRVLSRLLAHEGGDAPLWSLAAELVDAPEAGDVNQALMELGATTCLPFAAARCDACPWKESCRARALGRVAAIPAKAARAGLVAQTWAVALARRDDRRLVHQRDPTGLLHGMFEFPTFELSSDEARDRERTRAALAAFLERRFGARAEIGAERLSHRQVISNRKVTQRAFEVTLRGRTRAPARWLAPEEIGALAITMATRRILARLETEAAAAPLFTAAAAPSPRARPRPRAPRSSR